MSISDRRSFVPSLPDNVEDKDGLATSISDLPGMVMLSREIYEMLKGLN